MFGMAADEWQACIDVTQFNFEELEPAIDENNDNQLPIGEDSETQGHEIDENTDKEDPIEEDSANQGPEIDGNNDKEDPI